MTGLENILGAITGEAQAQANAIVGKAREQAAALLEQAKAEAEQAGKDVQSRGQQEADAIRGRASSAADLTRRNAMLAFKQEVLGETLDQVRNGLENAPAEEYFPALVQLAGKYARAGEAQLRLNQRDLDRLPEGFEAQVQAAAPQAKITLSREPAAISSGFLLVYEGIDVNCSYEALFADAESQLRDSLSRLLFPGKEPV